ncbi:hypothetical protein [Marinibactrum halimedae]|uniref:Uncharacterized protein n=1 Tax=Marinibactrum halimedae TaxID=1444977 RepID=A0AA37SZW5_9GAMM|nr:hypothetical protein [Marinibactrum halimedae]MCD9460669.1 hypothetical protein [Marinibactrum halimedae]GLS24314.1 hypothetical protein GCM10007877_00250 [Marinibactrum halimedae]
MLYTFISDNDHLGLVWDDKQITSIAGDSKTGAQMDDQIDFWRAPKRFSSLYKEALRVHFPVLDKADEKKGIPEICAVQGRLFLSLKAYTILKPLIEKDGEFLPLTYEYGEAYFFNPLRIADDVDALDTKLSCKNEWGDLENLAFHEEKLKDWKVFRTRFDGFYTLQGTQSFKDTIEKSGLKGLYITPELGRIFPEERSQVSQIN